MSDESIPNQDSGLPPESQLTELSTSESETAPHVDEKPVPQPGNAIKQSDDLEQVLVEEEHRRKRLLFLLALLLLLLCCVCGLFYQYWRQPKPLPELLPVVNVNYPPHYLFSIYGVNLPVGVAVSPDDERIYVSENGGDRLIKVFDRKGNQLFSFSPPNIAPGERAPVYMSVDRKGRVFVSERLQHAVFVYDKDGKYLDTILEANLTLTEYLSKHIGGLPSGSTFSYNVFRGDVLYQLAGQQQKTLPAPDQAVWSPLGLRFDRSGNLWVTDVSTERQAVREYPASLMEKPTWSDFNPDGAIFGITGQGKGQFLYPNMAVMDNQNRLYVVDGNNSRVSVWDIQGHLLLEFGKGTGDGALSLPRGAWIDAKDRLFIVDAVGHDIKVYDVSGPEPVFLYIFGGWGIDDGLFNYPNDLVMDETGRIYIADRENNRVQVWSY